MTMFGLYRVDEEGFLAYWVVQALGAPVEVRTHADEQTVTLVAIGRERRALRIQAKSIPRRRPDVAHEPLKSVGWVNMLEGRGEPIQSGRGSVVLYRSDGRARAAARRTWEAATQQEAFTTS